MFVGVNGGINLFFQVGEYEVEGCREKDYICKVFKVLLNWFSCNLYYFI